MTTFRLHDDVAVVEHDDATRQRREGGRVLAACVTKLTAVYVQADIEGYGAVTFWLESGWRAWTGDFGWRLVPLCRSCGEPVLGEPVTDEGDPTGREWCSEDCHDDSAQQQMERATA